MKTNTYTEDDIKILSDRAHVRKRTSIYLGNTEPTTYTIPLFLNNTLQKSEVTFIPAVYKAVNEIIDNSIDEFAQTYSKSHKLTIECDPEDGEFTIEDNGRGIPITRHSSGRYTPEVALGSLRSGRNFNDDKTAGVIGQNGVGSAVTNMISKKFNVNINRDGKEYSQAFLNGTEKTSQPIIQKSKKKSGTKISFTLDDTIFKNIALPNELLKNRAKELAFTNPSITVSYNGEMFRYRNGLDDIVNNLHNKDTSTNCNYFKFSNIIDDLQIQFYVIFDINKKLDECIYTYVNSSLLFDGGLCNTQFLNVFADKVIAHLEKEAKKRKCIITKNDIRQELLILGNLKISDPQYDAQSKTRLTGPNLRKEYTTIINDTWKTFIRKQKSWLDLVLERACDRHHIKANKDAINKHTKILRKRVLGLDDANNKNRMECQLLITEGQSAAGQILDVRNPKIHASFALTGKINNVYGCSPAQILQMGKLTNMLAAIGLIPGQKANRNRLRYGKVIISTDADFDGADIFSLLINIFYQFWPELFQDSTPYFYRLVAPNIVISKKTHRKFFTSITDYDKVKNKYSNWNVEYLKGLGSMIKNDWKTLLSNLDDFSIPIIDDDDMQNTLQLLFGNDTMLRKEWLQKEE